MYAHQVIEDLKNFKKLTNHYNGLVLDSKVLDINNAAKFNLGKLARDRIIKHKLGNNHFQNSKYLRMPYKLSWVDYDFVEYGLLLPGQILIPRRGMLVYQPIPEKVDVYMFYYHSGHKKWAPAIAYYQIFFDRIFTEEVHTGNLRVQQYLEVTPTLTNEEVMQQAYEDQDDMFILEEFMLLMNSKNITNKNNYPDKKLNLSRKKKGKQELFTYKTLEVTIPSNNKRGYQKHSIPLSHNRVHLCRGHFKEYTPEHPLFGQHVGLYWWQPSVRGQNRDGIVMKDYQINIKQQEVAIL